MESVVRSVIDSQQTAASLACTLLQWSSSSHSKSLLQFLLHNHWPLDLGSTDTAEHSVTICPSLRVTDQNLRYDVYLCTVVYFTNVTFFLSLVLQTSLTTEDDWRASVNWCNIYTTFTVFNSVVSRHPVTTIECHSYNKRMLWRKPDFVYMQKRSIHQTTNGIISA